MAVQVLLLCAGPLAAASSLRDEPETLYLQTSDAEKSKKSSINVIVAIIVCASVITIACFVCLYCLHSRKHPRSLLYGDSRIMLPAGQTLTIGAQQYCPTSKPVKPGQFYHVVTSQHVHYPVQHSCSGQHHGPSEQQTLPRQQMQPTQQIYMQPTSKSCTHQHSGYHELYPMQHYSLQTTSTSYQAATVPYPARRQ